jgi:hypothetical protein
MDRFPKLPLGLAAAAAFVCVSLAAQSSSHRFSIFPRKHHVQTAIEAEPAAPFPLDKEEPLAATDVAFRSAGQMTAADRQLEASSESAIARHAALEDFSLDEGHWSWQQIACRALPNHLFLRFTRDNGAGDRSMFSISIPRDGNGHLRIIPVLRRGFSLYSPAPSNNGTVAAFNQIRREDEADSNAGWLETGLCYAALAGANPSVGSLTGNHELDSPAPPLAEMLVLLNGGAIVKFTDQDARPHPMLWSMTFSPKGTLLEVKREPADLNAHWIVPQQTKQNQSTTIPASGQSAAANPSETSTSATPATPVSH